MLQFILFFRKKTEILLMSILTKDEIQSLLEKAELENDVLRNDIERYLFIIADATERIRIANDMADIYQRMFNELLDVIKTQYDAEFTFEDFLERLS